VNGDQSKSRARNRCKPGKSIRGIETRLSRCLRLLNLLQSRVGFSIQRLAEEAEVTPRTIFRDLVLLKDAGIPVWYDRTSRSYGLSPAFQIRTSPISPDELAAVMVAAHVFSLACAGELGDLVRQAIGKLLVQAPAGIQWELANLLHAITGDAADAPDATGPPRAIYEIFLALRQKRPLRIVYDSKQETVRPLRTKVTPEQLVAAQGAWHLIGRSSWHRKVHRFDLRHILSTEPITVAEDSAEPVAK
jgi:predicted DNA-binding transcriptional regulator YafY